MNNYKGQVNFELDPRLFNQILFNSITEWMTYTFDEINSQFLPVGLPSGARKLVSFEFTANPLTTTYIFKYTYINSSGVSTTVTAYSGTTFVDFYSAVYSFFGEKIETLLSITVTGNIKSEETSRFNQLNTRGFFVRSVNAVFLYTMNSSRNTVSKNITFVDNFYVKYNNPISYKQFTLDLERTDYLTFNYVYVTVLERYYFIENMVMMKNFYRLSLSEDVLMSWADVIRSQTAFVERSQSSYSNNLVDDEVAFDYDKDITVTTITPTATLFPTTQTEEDTRKSVVITTVIG